jgi:uncharacterized protein
MTEFTPLQSVLGGTLIGTAAVLLMALHGRIAGVTGILGGLLPPGRAGDCPWRVAFLAGMIGSPLLYAALSHSTSPTLRSRHFSSAAPSSALV